MKLAAWIRGSLTAILTTAALAGCSSAASSDERATESAATTDEALYGLGSIGGKWPNGIVPVCYSAESVNHMDLRNQIPSILELSWGRAGGITFTGFGACSGGNEVAFFFADNSRGNTDHLGYGHDTVTLTDNDPDPRRFPYQVIHEMGHALGFAHEQQRPDNWPNGSPLQCPPGDDDPKQYNPKEGGIYLTPTYDVNSVMNYCNPAGYPTSLSAGDIAGFAAAYGPAWLTTSPQAVTITVGDQKGVDIAITPANTWTLEGPISFWFTDLPQGVEAIPLDTYGTRYNLWAPHGPTGTFNVSVTGHIGSAYHTVLLPLTVLPQIIVPPPPPQLSMSLSATSSSLIAGNSSGIFASTQGTSGPVTFAASHLPYGLSVAFSGNNARVGDTISMGFWATPDAALGTFPVTITATANGLSASSVVSVEVDACHPATTCDGQCGTVSNGCGGTLRCPACCSTPKCQCEDAGGTWTGSTCKRCSTPAQCCDQAGGTWHNGRCL